MAKKTTKKPAGNAVSSKPKKASFPKTSLEEALKIAEAIKSKNGGNAWAPSHVGGAVGLSAKAPPFFYLAAASREYGLTLGSRDTAVIELTPLGREVVYAPNATVEKEKKIEAFLNVELFRRVLEYYNGSNLPEMKYLANTLEETFGIPPELHDEFSKVFRQNCEYLGIGSGTTLVTSPPGNTESVETFTKPATITIAEPANASNGRTAFVIMPFVERESGRPSGFFQEALRTLITPAARDAGFTVKTANRTGSDVIQSTIINDLLGSDLVIADLTEHNPNVLFELGVRIAKDKPVVLIKAAGTGRIFDVDNMMRVYEYNPNLWRTSVEKDLPALTEHIRGAWDNKDSEQSYMKILMKAASP